MNFQIFNAFNWRINTVLLTTLISFSPFVLAVPLENKSPVQQHHKTHDTTMATVSPVSMQNLPEVDSVEHTEHSKPVTHVALPDEKQMNSGLRKPDYSDGYRSLDTHHMMSSPNFWSLEAEALELIRNADYADGHIGGHYDLKFWYGNDYNRLYLNTSGELEQDKLQQASSSVMWWRPFSAYWNTTFGLKQEYVADNNDQTWLGGGVSGLAPYWFDIETTLYGSTKGNSQLGFNASYDLNISQKWVLQPKIELLAYGKTSIEHRYGAGLAQVNTGLRLRYEITPQLAPYIGFEHEQFVGKTATLYKDHGDNSRSRNILLGLHFWY
ncbi:MAG: copper resistance protein B [Moraxellaceae bacterium]|nr:MAG: copper resistance protein B [Moraxellaceae bacterium]